MRVGVAMGATKISLLGRLASLQPAAVCPLLLADSSGQDSSLSSSAETAELPDDFIPC